MEKALPYQVEQVAPLKFGAKWKYVTDHAPESISAPGYFRNCAHFFETGCEIEVMAWLAQGYAKATFHVVASSPQEVVIEVGPGGWTEYGAKRAKSPAKAPVRPKTENAAKDSEFINGKAVWKGMRERWVVFIGNRAVAKGLDKDTAHAVARGDKPLPQQKAA